MEVSDERHCQTAVPH